LKKNSPAWYNILGQHRTIPRARLDGKSTLQMRYFFWQYTKYSGEKVPFCNALFLADPHTLNCAVLP
jgi:hypothetical protein